MKSPKEKVTISKEIPQIFFEWEMVPFKLIYKNWEDNVWAKLWSLEYTAYPTDYWTPETPYYQSRLGSQQKLVSGIGWG